MKKKKFVKTHKYVRHIFTKASLIIVFSRLRDKVEVTKTLPSTSDEYQLAKTWTTPRQWQLHAQKFLIEDGSGLEEDNRGVVTCTTKSGDKVTVSPVLLAKISRSTSAKEKKRLKKFLERLQRNKSPHCVAQLFNFIEKHGITLEDDGTFFLHKAVRGYSENSQGYPSQHDSRFIYRMGKWATEKRYDINPNISCGRGLHVAPPRYIGSFGGSVVLKVLCEPEHVVSVPHSGNCEKIRLYRVKPTEVVASSTSIIDKKASKKKLVDKDDWVGTTPVEKVDMNEIILPHKTDRITIPKDFLNMLGWKERVKLIHTDPRSRFMMLIPDSFHDRVINEIKPTGAVWTKEVACPPISIRDLSLAQCRIEGYNNYSVKPVVVQVKKIKYVVLEVRPVK